MHFVGDKTSLSQGDSATIIQAAITVTQQLWRAGQWFDDHVTVSSHALSIITQFSYTAGWMHYQFVNISNIHLTHTVTLFEKHTKV